jgi:hypothetical protein
MNAPLRSHGVEVAKIHRGCIDKKRYPNEETARAAGMHYIDAGQIKHLWWYTCSICRGYHLTSKGGSAKRHVMVGFRKTEGK